MFTYQNFAKEKSRLIVMCAKLRFSGINCNDEQTRSYITLLLKNCVNENSIFQVQFN